MRPWGAPWGLKVKWFKHFTDMHEGRSINDLLDQLGHTGLCFFLLQEMCARKLEKPEDGELTEADCLFHFHPRIVRQKLRISPANLRHLLDVCAANGLLSYNLTENSVEISMPILLNLLDRDSKKARHTRASDAEKQRLDKDKEKNNKPKKNDPVFLASIEKVYASEYPRKEGLARGLKLLAKEIKNEKDAENFCKAISNYAKKVAAEKTEKKYIKQFSTFCGGDWQDYVEWQHEASAAKSSSYAEAMKRLNLGGGQ